MDIGLCIRLEVFPPITGMKKLETFILYSCYQLRKFPDIETNMDNLVELDLEGSGIEVVPSSIGRYCTNLHYLDLSRCRRLKSIEGNFHRLQHLKKIYLEGSDQLKMPAEGLFDVKCCLQVLSLHHTSFKEFRQGMVSMKLPGFSTCLRRLNLSRCNLEDGDISSVFFQELSNLQVLDLSHNDFSRLHSSLSQLPRLKFLNLSNCHKLVELPDLPSSIAILIVDCCVSLQIVGGLLTNHLKWLWKVSLVTNSGRVDGKRVVESILQGNAVEDYFICLYSNKFNISTRDFGIKRRMLELPSNWKDGFSGFLIYVTGCGRKDLIIIEDAMDWENEGDVLKVSDYGENKTVNVMGYISFGSLSHTTWWNSTHTTISFFIEHADFKVELVPKRCKGDSIERPKDATNSSEFWDEEDGKTFEIKHDSKSSIRIEWWHDIDRSRMFRRI